MGNISIALCFKRSCGAKERWVSWEMGCIELRMADVATEVKRRTTLMGQCLGSQSPHFIKKGKRKGFLDSSMLEAFFQVSWDKTTCLWSKYIHNCRICGSSHEESIADHPNDDGSRVLIPVDDPHKSLRRFSMTQWHTFIASLAFCGATFGRPVELNKRCRGHVGMCSMLSDNLLLWCWWGLATPTCSDCIAFSMPNNGFVPKGTNNWHRIKMDLGGLWNVRTMRHVKSSWIGGSEQTSKWVSWAPRNEFWELKMHQFGHQTWSKQRKHMKLGHKSD